MSNSYKKAVRWLSAGHFTLDAYSGFINAIMPFIATKIGITMAIATVVISISQLVSQLLQPIFGFFADNIFKRGFIFWGLLLTSIFTPLCASARNLTELTTFIVLGSFGVSLFHPQAIGFVIRFTKKDFTKNMGLFLSLGSIGYSFGPAISATVLQFMGLEKIPYLSLWGIFLAFIMFKCVPKISNKDKKPEGKRSLIKTFKDIFENNQIKILILISIMKALISSSCAILLPFLWKDMGHSPMYIGLALFLFLFMGGLGSLTSPKVEKIFGTKPIFYGSMLLTLPLMLVFVLTYKDYHIISLIAFVSLAYVIMLATPITMVLAQKELPKYKSIIGGFLNGFCWGVVGILMSTIGFLAENFGILNILICLSVVPVISSYFIRYLKVEKI